MRILATLKNFTSSDCKRTIVRNLNRIMDLRILDLDADSGTITFLYQTEDTLEKVKRELNSIGYPLRIQKANGNGSLNMYKPRDFERSLA